MFFCCLFFCGFSRLCFCCLPCFCFYCFLLPLLLLHHQHPESHPHPQLYQEHRQQQRQQQYEDSKQPVAAPRLYCHESLWVCNYRTTPQPPLQLVQAKPSPNHFESPRTAAHPSKTPGTKALKKQSINLDPPEWNDMDGICLIRFQAIHFSHPFARYRKMQDGQAGRILEINELLEWPSESNPRPAVTVIAGLGLQTSKISQ